MPHVYCLNGVCRKVNHLNTQQYWNYKGTFKCQHCSTWMEIEIVEGVVKSLTPAPKEQ
jgi:hypothetical protein